MLVNLLKLPVRWLFKLLYRVQIVGVENFHAAGDRVLIVSNHVSLLDGMLFYLFFPERPTFAINKDMAAKWYFKPFLWFVDLFLLDPTNPISMKSLIKFLREDRKAVIFPEGRITVTGSLMKIYDGPGMVADKAQAVILPVGIEGAQYTPLSYLRGSVRIRWFPKITIRFLTPETIEIPEQLHGSERRKAAANKLTKIMRRIAFENCDTRTTMFESLLEAMRRHGPALPIMEDIQRTPLTYKQLVVRAFILGAAIAQDTHRGEHVGLLLPNVNATVVALLGCQARGRVPAMLNFTAGPQGLVIACETAQIRQVYTSRAFIENADLGSSVDALSERVNVTYLEDLRPRVSAVMKLSGLLASRFPRWAFRRWAGTPDPDAAAVILFTSGSEGIPKGVVLSHANLLANRAQVQTLIDLTHQDVVFNAMPIFHAFGLLGGVILPLLDGARMFLYPSPLHYRLIPELCYELRATVLFGTNTFLAGYARHSHPYDFNTMRYVVAGAEKVHADTRRIWADKLGKRILEGYGATEASPVLAVNTPMENRPGSVGQLLTAVDYYLEPVEGIAEGGRLVVSGPNVMRGYLFHGSEGELVSPWTEQRGSGWYDTGDICTVDDDGCVVIVGRAKRFAKIAGEMVSLTGVEELATVTWPEGLHAATTIADSRKGEQIVLLTDHADALRKPLIETARKTGVSEITIPRHIISVDEVPVLGTGKFDYRAINELVHERMS